MALPKPVASTHLYPAKLVVAAVVGGAELSAVEAEEDINLGLAVVCPSACPAGHSYGEVEAGIQEGSCWVVVLGMLVVVVVAGFALEEAEKLLRRRSQGLRLRRDP